MSTDAEIRARLIDLHALAITMDAEGRGDASEGGSSVEERIAIGCTIRTRADANRKAWGGETIRGVCLQDRQYSCWTVIGGSANYTRTMAIARSLVEGGSSGLGVADLDLLHESMYLAEGIIGRQLLDRIKGATHYYAPAAMVGEPAWAKGKTPIARVGRQLFFKGV